MMSSYNYNARAHTKRQGENNDTVVGNWNHNERFAEIDRNENIIEHKNEKMCAG